MNDSQIRNLIQSEIHKTSQSNRFNVANVQRHTHNDIDSPFTFQPILTYVGVVGQGTANANPVTINLLPKGWTISRTGTGVYTVTHNLNTLLYSCVASSIQSTNVFGVPNVDPFINSFSISWYDALTLSNADTGFDFTLTVINNKSQKLPVYTGTLTV